MVDNDWDKPNSVSFNLSNKDVYSPHPLDLIEPKTFEEDKIKPRLEVLAEREKTHGSFTTVAKTAVELRSVLVKHGIITRTPSPVMNEALNQICTKLARITQNPSNIDNWKDIAGYATLVVEELEF